ncbi:ABC transporter ATP-binding protein [Spirochaetia bacterium]|nr:ABC transporter ATP-binding protein [Spirochaetia bacterium]
MAYPLLSAEHLSIGIREGGRVFTAVEDVNFRVHTGEIAGIVGESGCGKSLTALSIAGLLTRGAEVIGGAVYFDTREGMKNLLKLNEKELCKIRGKDISFVFQEPYPSLNPLVKVGDQITETLFIHGEKDRAKNRTQAIELMHKLGLEDAEKLMDAYPHRLSGGMCQRVMIAMAMICKPKLLIADEPTTALDVTIQAQILDLMKRITAEYGTSILFISHDLSIISRLCDRVLVMYAGRIAEEGSAAEVFANPGHEYTKGLIGSIPGRNRKGKDLANIPGKVPPVEEKRVPGCPFAPRCSKVTEQCIKSFPPGREISPGHFAYCIQGSGL